MQFTRVIFNTYSFFKGSDAKAKLTPAFLTVKNSLLCSLSINAKDIFSTHAPLKIYLSIESATCLLNNYLASPFLLLINNLIAKLCLAVNDNPKVQGY